jgi:hypothetical protein
MAHRAEINTQEAGRMQQRIMYAANRCGKTKQIAIGVRHFCPIMRNNIEAMYMGSWATSEQGFIDQYGAFLTRTEAWVVASAAGQIIRRCDGDDDDGGTLYSENLY